MVPRDGMKLFNGMARNHHVLEMNIFGIFEPNRRRIRGKGANGNVA
jgi:hypothetical protein